VDIGCVFPILILVAINHVCVQTHFHVRSISSNTEEVSSAVYLQVSIISQALIFVTRSQSWSFLERPGILLMCAFVVAQLVSLYPRKAPKWALSFNHSRIFNIQEILFENA